MRNFQAYFFQLFHERLYPLFFLGTAAMAAALASGNLLFPERFLSDLFGPGGGMYVLLCCTAIICTFVGKDHAYRGFQSKVFYKMLAEQMGTAVRVKLCGQSFTVIWEIPMV